MYQYRARVVRVIDGDTAVVDIDAGFGIWLHQQSIRLLGLNARELHDPGGREARLNLAALLPTGIEVVLTTVKADKYGGRYDAGIQLGALDVNAQLITDGWAAAWDGQGPKPVPDWPRTERTKP